MNEQEKSVNDQTQIVSKINIEYENILEKLESLGKDLSEFSLETVQMFYDDAQKAGYTIKIT